MRAWFDRMWFALRACFRDPILYPVRRCPAFDADHCATTFIRNYQLIHHYADHIGAIAIMYVQPANGIGRRPLSAHDLAALAHLRRRLTVDGLNQVDALNRFYRNVRARLAGRTDGLFQDLTEVFDDIPHAPYIDHGHPSDIGYDIIARRIAEDVLRREVHRRAELC